MCGRGWGWSIIHQMDQHHFEIMHYIAFCQLCHGPNKLHQNLNESRREEEEGIEEVYKTYGKPGKGAKC